MEEKDALDTQEWRPTLSLMSLSSGWPSTARSSILSPLGTAASPSPELKLADRPKSIDATPFETTICDRMIEDVEIEVPFQAALLKAKDNFQRHAKWFHQSGIERLLRTALVRATNSRATVDLYAALELVDCIGTFAIIPPQSIFHVVRFVAYAYYQGTRMNKHRSLAKKAWGVLQHLLQGHLCHQAIAALLEVLRFAQSNQSKAGFAAAAGVLRLIVKKLPLGEHDGSRLPAVSIFELLPGLKAVALGGDEILKEQVLDVLARILTEEPAVAEIEATASWDACAEILGLCRELDHPAADLVAGNANQMSTESRKELALFFIREDRALADTLRNGILEYVAPMFDESGKISSQGRDLFVLLCSRREHHQELEMLIGKEIELLQVLGDQDAWQELMERYVDQTMSDSTTSLSAVSCTVALGTLLHTVFSFADVSDEQRQKVSRLIEALSAISSSAHDHLARLSALKTLSRLRAAIDGAVYLAPDDTIDCATPSGTAPQGIKAIELPLEKWLETVFALIDGRGSLQDEHAVNFVLAAMPEQLSNLSLFYKRNHFPKAVYNTASERLSGRGGAHAASFVQLSTTLISYRRLFSDAQQRQMFDVFIKTAGSSDTVSKACIHAITICCHEMPETAMRYLENIVLKMHRLVTQRHLAVHVLEFLTGLSRQETLYNNFRFEDFKRIFGVCFSYLESLRTNVSDQRSLPSLPSDKASSSERDFQQALPQYVYALAHHVVVFWYFSVRKGDRPAIKEYVTSRLKYKTLEGEEIIEDQGLVTIDLMDSVDAEIGMENRDDDLLPDNVFDEKLDGRLTVRHRFFGLLLITTHTALRNGKTLVTVRRPSGTFRSMIRGGASESAHTPSNAEATLHTGPDFFTAPIAQDNQLSPVFAEDKSGLLYGNVRIPSPMSPLGSYTVIELPESPAVTSAIKIFDRTPGLDSHKAGVIYIGEGQTSEQEAFLNASGSPDYRDFVSELGTLRRLRNAKFNTQGLDRSDGNDGEFAVVWNNEVTELVWHVTTLMPMHAHDEGQMTVARKKRHTGNDFVNVVFNNSGLPFQFGMFPSAFAYIYIVITPSVRTTFLQTRTHTMSEPAEKRFYRVEVMTAEDFPPISSAAEPKMISGKSLAGYVRNVALNACIFSEVWVNKDREDYRSSWRERLRQIRQLRERYGPKDETKIAATVPEVYKGKGKGKSLLAALIGGKG